MLYDAWEIEGYNLVRIEYSGHGFRFKEPLISEFPQMLEDIISSMNVSNDDEYILFGHSMGGLLAWMLAHEMKRRGLKEPERIIISGCEPPDTINTRLFHKYTDYDEVVEYVRHFNRFSEKRIKSEVFVKFFFPIIQNDFRLVSSYQYKETEALDIPMDVIYSKDDSIMRCDTMEGWKKFSSDVEFYVVEGDHFFIEEEKWVNHIISLI